MKSFILRNKLFPSFSTSLALFLALGGGARAFSAPSPNNTEPRLTLAAVVSTNDDGLPSRIQGSLVYTGQDLTVEDHCFYLPFNDVSHAERAKTSRRYTFFQSHYSVIPPKGGSIAISVAGKEVPLSSFEYPYLIKLHGSEGIRVGRDGRRELVLDFKSQVPRLDRADPDDWFIHGFYPVLLQSCPTAGADANYFPYIQAFEIDAQLQTPDGWILAAPGNPVAGENPKEKRFSLHGREFSFGLAKHSQTQKFDFQNYQVEMFYTSKHFADLIPTIKSALNSNLNWLGDLPSKRLVILETADVEPTNLPGMIVMNKPKQSLAKRLQSGILNWPHWVVSSLIAGQWYGGWISVENPDDDWFIDGMIDFATSESLALDTERTDFFNSFESGVSILKFTYFQFHELSAAMLMRSNPLYVLTDSEFHSLDPYYKQVSLGFVRHSAALHHLKARLGNNTFMRFLKNYTQKSLLSSVGPKTFFSELHQTPEIHTEKKRDEAERILRDWWTSDRWPDVAVEKFESEPTPDGKWIAKVDARQSGIVTGTATVRVTDVKGKEYFGNLTGPDASNTWTYSVETEFEPKKADIDPKHETFDSDRFNSRSDSPSVRFFPGSANTLADADYTVIWLPYVFRRPGENTSIGVGGNLFRHLQSGMEARLEYMPSDKKAGFSLRSNQTWPQISSSSWLHASQNYEGFRLVELGGGHTPTWTKGFLGFAGEVRHRQIVGQSDTSHRTVAADLNLGDLNLTRLCELNLTGESEQAPKMFTPGFRYSRNTGTARGHCGTTSGIDMFTRGFWGKMEGTGEIPDLAYFAPENLQESRIRLDMKDVARVNDILSSSNDLLLPLVLPMPSDTLVLSRQMKARLFYDIGRSYEKELIYRAAGAGIHIPIGGDFSGIGSLAFTRISILGVLYSQVGDETSKRPRILFDITGEL